MERSDNPEADLRVGVSDVQQSTALYASVLGIKSDPNPFHQGDGNDDGRNVPFPEPGQGMLRVFVRSINTLTETLKSAGFSVITTGGAPVTLPQGQRVIILRDPNNFYLQLMEAR